MDRRVVILCGPPGAGKTTAARASGLQVFDRDDAQWSSESQFVEAIGRLAREPEARAVVIRSGATSSARAKWSQMTAATECLLVWAPLDVCLNRVRARRREDFVAGTRGVRTWFEAFDDADGVPMFAGWSVEAGLGIGKASREW